jgi:signal peptidase I
VRYGAGDDDAVPRSTPRAGADGPGGADGERAAAGADDHTGDDHHADDADEHDGRRGGSLLRSVVEWVVVVIGALAVAMVLRAFLFQAYWIPSESMEDTLRRDDRVLVNRLSYRLHDINHGDVIVFERPPSQPDNGIEDLIKRVVAVEGETVEGRDGQVVVDGRPLDEDYVAEAAPIGDFGPVVVPEGHVFVMGDNRDNSVDSRVFGPIDEDSVIGRAFVLFWPLDRLGWL